MDVVLRSVCAGSLLVAACGVALACSGGGGEPDDAVGADAGALPPAVATMPPDASSCRDGSEAVQRHGTACLCCHSDEFGVAGSVDPIGSVARVVVTGADGDQADMVPDSFGNFFRHFPMATPVSAVVYGRGGARVAMRELSPSADCNGCHFAGGPVAPISGP
jgi:hypothetical protein